MLVELRMSDSDAGKCQDGGSLGVHSEPLGLVLMRYEFGRVVIGYEGTPDSFVGLFWCFPSF